MATEFDPEDVVKQVTESLSKKFPERDRNDVEAQVRQAVNDLKDRPITDYVGVLAQRAVKKQLKSS
jgi:phage-related baseplate assembly protein